MKARGTLAVLICLASFALIFLTQSSVVRAADQLYFDAFYSDYWNYGFGGWSSDPGPPYYQNWIDGSDAHFEGLGDVVNVSGTINSVNSITFDVDNYRLSNGTITLTGAGGNITTGSGTDTINSKIAGAVGLTKLGSGTLVLGGANSYSGPTYISAGKILLASGTAFALPTTTDVILSDTAGAGMDINGQFQIIASLSGGGTNGGNVSLGQVGAIGRLWLNNTNNAIYVGVISGYGSLTKQGAGTQILSGANTYTGETHINAGVLRLAEGDNRLPVGTSVQLENEASAILDINNQKQTIASLAGGGAAGGNVHLGSGTLTLGAGNSIYYGVISGEGGNLVVEGPTGGSYYQSLTGANTYTGTTTIKSGTLKLSGGNNRLSPESSVVMADNYSAVLDLTNLNQTISTLSGGGPGMGTSMPGGRIVLGSSGTLTVGDETDTTFAGSIMASASGSPIPGGTLIKQGSGTLTLSGQNYLFGTHINEGKIKLLGSGLGAVTLANVAGVSLDIEGSQYLSLFGGGENGGNVLVNGEILQIQQGDYAGIISGNENIIIGPTFYISYPEFITTLSGANNYEGSTTIDNKATLRLAGGDNRLPVTTTLIMGSGGGTFDLGGQTQTVAALKSAPNTSGGIIKLSSGNLILNNDNDCEFVGTINGEGTLTKQGAGTLTLQANISNTTINVNQGCLTLGGAYGINLNSTTDVALANAADVALHIPRNSAAIKTLSGGGENGGNIILGEGAYIAPLTVQEGNYAGIITGVGDFSKTGTGTLVLSGQNSYNGFTQITGGTLRLDGGSERLPSGSLTISSLATLDLNGCSQTIAYLGGNSGSKIQLGSGTCIINQGSMNGVIEGEGNLIKQSSFSLGLSRDNTYTGTTTVLGGTLNVTGSLTNNGSGKIFVAADRTDFIATISRTVGIDASYAGFGSTALGDAALGTAADLIDGTNTGTAKSLSMQWRLRNDDDLAASLVSDVMNLSGMENDGIRTDQFTLLMSYSVDALPGGADAEAALAAAGKIQLVWFNDTDELWQNAALDNVGDGNEPLFMGIGSTNDGLLGHWGIDTLNHTVWAVLDHNSQFAVAVPEPGTLALLAGALLALSAFGVRRVDCRFPRRSAAVDSENPS